MKKILKFLLGAKPSLAIRENHPCVLIRDGGYCPFTGCFMDCKVCEYYKGGKDE